MMERFDTNAWDNWECFQLAIEAEQITLAPNFEELLCLDQLKDVVLYDHQIQTAKRVLNELHGRAILADEVGLGKTIEAGMIIKEYMIRGLVKKVLILVPASLVSQWTRELNQKFQIPAYAQKKEWAWTAYDCIVASIDTTKRDPHRQIVLDQEWDMVIVDEAHKLKNNKTQNWQMVNQLRKKYLLLLTATPVQNDLKELYNLITLLKPGQLGNIEHFMDNYVEEKRLPKNSTELKSVIDEVMIRNKRSEGNIQFTKRIVTSIPVELSPEERNLYDAVSAFVKDEYNKRKEFKLNVLPLMILQREICSSPYAAAVTLESMLKDPDTHPDVKMQLQEMYHLIERIPQYTKVQKVMELIRDIDDKVIIFTEYRASQDFLMYMLKKQGIMCVPFRGGFKRGKKDWMRELFEKKARVLIATEAGGEGINLQFCNQIINFDLPWNPMRLEQRIGRVHRLGQTRDVHIYNLSTKDTIEEHIVHLLQEKIRMFEMVIGELDLIIGKLRMKTTFEKKLMEWIVTAKDKDELQQQLDQLGSMIQQTQQDLQHEELEPFEF
ncbi:DEAD/DEAH box helicase [Fodinisporobacter ferrooxydans]|uniref:DEAD/DEAH box helicase n=1 Tax=Fodinisporobacter ferrooxydans TaxID=2901836 RepID=A0ABY4CRN5_9BACL|nr:DEAD/DEAH box helicase [Alicyclobacillaceae bacterium MYW30-H2]